ncbi:MAG: Metalloenzyme, LuxS/M16 peptidase-like protein, partial [Olpidium bornovanus]
MNGGSSNYTGPYRGLTTRIRRDLTTLKEIPERLGLNIREELLKFYRRYYSANVMRAAVLGRGGARATAESIDDLTKLVTEKFGPIVNYNVDEEHFASQPSQYIGHLIGHEGRGSILSLLKKKGRIHLARGFDTFYVSVELTPDGLGATSIRIFRRRTSALPSIEDQTEVVNGKKKSGTPNSSPVSLFVFLRVTSQIRDLSVMDFRFKEKFYAAKYTSNLASLLHKPCPPEWILSMSVVREFRPDLIEESLGHLNGETVQVELVSKEWAPEKTAKEQWYGTEYAVEPISAELRDRIRRALAGGGAETEAGAEEDLHLPLSNAFIPTNFETNKSHVGEFHLRSPLAYADARTCVMTNLFVALLRDAVAEFAYDAEVAGLQYSLQSHAEGLLLDVRGFNDKMAALLERLDRFYKNIELDAPFRYADFHLNYSTHERLFTPAERMTELQCEPGRGLRRDSPDITAEDVQTHIPNLFSRVHIEALATGNIRREEALAHVETLERLLSPKSLPRSQIVPRRSIVLPKALLSLLADVTRQPFFDQMRTKEKLGYIAASGMQKQSTTVGLKLVIQSERDTVHLENRIEAFLRNIEGVIGNMTDAEFQRHVDSVIHRKTEKLENIVSESVRFWTNIRSGYYEFDALDNEVEHLRNVTRGELRGFFLERVHPDSAARSKFSVHVRSQRAPRARNPERGAAAAVDAAGL